MLPHLAYLTTLVSLVHTRPLVLIQTLTFHNNFYLNNNIYRFNRFGECLQFSKRTIILEDTLKLQISLPSKRLIYIVA